MRAQTDCQRQARDRFIRLTIEGQRITKIAMRGSKIRIELDGATKLRHCLLGLPPNKCDISQGKMRPRIAVVEFGRTPG